MGEDRMKIKSFLVLCLAFCFVCVPAGCAKEETPVLTFGDHRIYSEEFSLYCDIVNRDLIDREDTQALYRNAAQYAVEAYSLFDLAVEYQAAEPFSFETLKTDMEQENKTREEKIAKGEAVMGVRQFELADYFEYVLADYKQKTAAAIAKTPSEEVLKEAKRFYEEDKENYISDATYEYQVKTQEDGQEKTEIKTITYDELTVSYHSMDVLGDVLTSGNIGEEYDLGSSKVTLLNREVTYQPFEEVQGSVLTSYVSKEYLPELLKNRAAAADVSLSEDALADYGR